MLISLKTDYVFKELFAHENVRKQFLSDVLDIPLEEMKSVRIMNPFLRRRFRRQKEGILDMALEMVGGAKVNIELQVRRQENWVKRKLFYLARLYTEDLFAGQNYDRLRKCISISLLDFNLTQGEEYHTEYRLRTKGGKELTDLFELHIVELRKPLGETDGLDDWIRLFNATAEEDLEMIKIKNAGIREAIEELRTMSLARTLRFLYEERLKARRDRWAEDEYVRNEGRAEGRIEGQAEGRIEGTAQSVLLLLNGLGDVPSELSKKIRSEKNMDTLNQWLKAAAKAESIEQFIQSSSIRL